MCKKTLHKLWYTNGAPYLTFWAIFWYKKCDLYSNKCGIAMKSLRLTKRKASYLAIW